MMAAPVFNDLFSCIFLTGRGEKLHHAFRAVRWNEKMGYDVWDMCNLKNARRSV